MGDADRIAKERALRSAVLRGEEVAWQAWYDESCAELLAYVTWRCGGRRESASDIVQETWLAAVRQIPAFDPERGSFAGWLRGIAQNLLKNQVRKAQRAAQSLEGLAVDPAATPGSFERQAEQSDRIAAALAALPERYEAALKAKYFDQLPVKLIADEWNETPKVIESLLTRAREAFRRLYDNPDCELPGE